MTRVPGSRAARCIGEPVSWLRLERFHLGELGGADRAPVADHLAACDACAACLARVRQDDDAPLPELPVAQAGVLTARTPSRAPGTPRERGLVSLFPGGSIASLVALAAAVAVVVGLRGEGLRGEAIDEAAQTARVKGGAVAFALVRDDGERFVGAEGVYRDGDRFKAVVTCPPGGRVGFDVVVREGGRESFPLASAPAFACGNDVPLPGAFRLTGSAEETVCLVWSEGGAVDRRDPLAPEARPALCKRLAPSP